MNSVVLSIQIDSNKKEPIGKGTPRLRLVILLFGLLHTWLLSSQASFQNKLQTFFNVPELVGSSIGFHLINVSTGQEIATWDADRILIPASTLKVLTTATALGMLGQDFRFETYLEHTGKLEGGVLTGDLYITGNGDPTLGSSLTGRDAANLLLEEWQHALTMAGIREIRGAVRADISRLDGMDGMRSWLWEDLGNYYGAAPGALNFHENLYFLHFNQTKTIGKAPAIHSMEPEVPGLQFDNQVRTAETGTGDNAWIFGAPHQDRRTIRGTIPAGNQLFTIKGSLPDPPAFLAWALTQKLQSCGISVSGEPSVSRELLQEKRTKIHTHYSPRLEQIAAYTNRKSHNLFAEALLLRLSAKEGHVATYQESIRKLQSFWENAGLPGATDLLIKDGSGLSMRNGLTARQLCHILYLTARHPDQFPGFINSLPVAGKDGTLKSFLVGTAAAGKVIAKSGSMDRVLGYAGFLEKEDGEWYAFTLLVNNFIGSSATVRRIIEEVLLTLYLE